MDIILPDFLHELDWDDFHHPRRQMLNSLQMTNTRLGVKIKDSLGRTFEVRTNHSGELITKVVSEVFYRDNTTTVI